MPVDTRDPTNQTAAAADHVVGLILDAFDPRHLEAGAVSGDPEQLAAVMQQALPKLITEQHERFKHARTLFLRDDQSGVAPTVFERMDRLLLAAKPFEPETLCSDDEFAALLDLAATVDEGGDTESAVAMYTLLQALRPDQHQPFINHFNIVWQTLGVKAAADCYRMVSPLMASPIFFYYASDCFELAGRQDDARLAIAFARELIDDPEYGCSVAEDVARGIRATYDRLGAGRMDDENPPPGGAVFV